jgi:hypothetical protein
MTAVEVQGMDPKYTWKIIDIYRALYEDMRWFKYWQPEPVIREILQSIAS